MAFKRKYEYYTLVTEFDEEEFTKYTDAVSAYWKADSATLYGTDEQGSVTCIMSK